MKKVLLASTALVFAGGMAMAEVEVSGSAKMGVGNWLEPSDTVADDLTFISEVGFSFTGSGETDGGLTFGGSLDSDDSGDMNTGGVSGTVFIEGAFGKLSMGDVDGAAKAAVGHVSGVGLDLGAGLWESTYVANVGPDTPGALYEGSFGDFTVYASADNPTDSASGDNAYALGMSYGMGNYTFALGYESNDAIDADHIIAGLSAGFGDATLKAIYGTADVGGVDGDQWAISIDYVFGMTTVTAFYTDDEELGGAEAYGIGAAYDLGGGASLKAGIIDSDSLSEATYDFGVSMSF